MYGINSLGLAALAAFAVAPGATRTTPQINLSIWFAPDCPYGYFDYAPHNCAPDGYYGPRNGFVAAHSLALARGLVVPTTSKAWWITLSIHSTAITAHCPRLAKSAQHSGEPRDYSMETKCAMDKVTYASKAWAARRSISRRLSVRTVEPQFLWSALRLPCNF